MRISAQASAGFFMSAHPFFSLSLLSPSAPTVDYSKEALLCRLVVLGDEVWMVIERMASVVLLNW